MPLKTHLKVKQPLDITQSPLASYQRLTAASSITIRLTQDRAESKQKENDHLYLTFGLGEGRREAEHFTGVTAILSLHSVLKTKVNRYQLLSTVQVFQILNHWSSLQISTLVFLRNVATFLER